MGRQLSIVKNGMETMRLPPGFRFYPTDEELVLHYLRRKVYFVPLPAAVISQFEVSRSDPWDLPGDAEEDRYFFSSTKDLKGGRSSNRATLGGYWKVTGNDKPVLTSRRPQVVVGMKKTLVFFTGKSLRGTRTDWIMHEYRLASLKLLFLSGYAPLPNQLTQVNWVVCRISRKKKRTTNPKKKGTTNGRIDNGESVGVSGLVVSPASSCISGDSDSDSDSDSGFSSDSDSEDGFDSSEEEWCRCGCDSSEAEAFDSDGE